MTNLKFTIAKDYAEEKSLKAGDMLVIRAKVTAVDGAAECEIDSCEKEGKAAKVKKGMKPLDYLRAKRRGEL